MKNLPNPKVIKLVQREDNDLEVLGAAFMNEDPSVRRKALKSMNLASKAFSDECVRYARNRWINLSSFAGNPTSTGQNTPGAVVFSDADRQVVDISWLQLFRIQDNRGVANDTFIIEDTYNAIEFREYVPGSPVDIGAVTYGRNRFEYRTLAGGFQYEVLWSEDYPYWKVADGMVDMQTKYALQLEEIALTTLTAAGGLSVSYQAGANAAEQDIATINEAQRVILNAMYTDTDPEGNAVKERVTRPVFFLLYNEFGTGMTNRVNRAVAAAYATPNDVLGGLQVNHPVIPFPSPYVTGTDWHLVYPGRKNTYALKNDLNILMSFDPFAAGGVDARIGHGRIGNVRGDSNQVATLATT